jgi:hypothetical protein
VAFKKFKIENFIAWIFVPFKCKAVDIITHMGERAILTTTNNRTSFVNRDVLSRFEGPEINYDSVDTVSDSEECVHLPT